MTYAKRAKAFDSHVENCRACQNALMAAVKSMLCKAGRELHEQIRKSQERKVSDA
jgi:hypothetical protein